MPQKSISGNDPQLGLSQTRPQKGTRRSSHKKAHKAQKIYSMAGARSLMGRALSLSNNGRLSMKLCALCAFLWLDLLVLFPGFKAGNPVITDWVQVRGEALKDRSEG